MNSSTGVVERPKSRAASTDRGVRDSQNVRDSKGSIGFKNTSALEPSETGQLTELQASLKELLDVQKDTEYLDLSE